MMMKLEQVPTFFFAQTQRCSHQLWTTLSAKDKPFCTVDQWMDHSQSAVSRTSLSTACRMLRESASTTMLSTECLNAERTTSVNGISHRYLSSVSLMALHPLTLYVDVCFSTWRIHHLFMWYIYVQPPSFTKSSNRPHAAPVRQCKWLFFCHRLKKFHFRPFTDLQCLLPTQWSMNCFEPFKRQGVSPLLHTLQTIVPASLSPYTHVIILVATLSTAS